MTRGSIRWWSFLIMSAVLRMSCSGAGTVTITRPYSEVVDVLSYQKTAVSRDKRARATTITYVDQIQMFQGGPRYTIRIRELTPTTTEVKWTTGRLLMKEAMSSNAVMALYQRAEQSKRDDDSRKSEYRRQHGDMKLNDALVDAAIGKGAMSEEQQLAQIRKLIADGANVNAISLRQSAPLWEACIHAKAGVVALLLENGANPNLQVSGGWTPLHAAAMFSPATVLTLLLDHGGDLTIRGDRGETVLEIAEQSRYAHRETIDLLKSMMRGGKGEDAQTAPDATGTHGTPPADAGATPQVPSRAP
jgi:hypothetical protein